jgi:hypothetical protein
MGIVSGNSIIVSDNAVYSSVTFKDEVKEFEPLVVDHIIEIFGESAVYYPKRTIKSLANNRSIPDGFVIDIRNKKWYILELKLLCNDAIERIPGQIKNYEIAVKNPDTKQNIFESIDKRSDVLYDIIYHSKPEIVIIIDSLDGEMGKQFVERVNEDINIIEFKTYSNNLSADKPVFLHMFNPLPKPNIGSKTAKNVEEILKIADANGVGIEFRRIHKTAIELGLALRPYRWSIMYSPPSHKTIMLFTIWANDKSHKLKMWSLADRYTKFVPVSREEVISALGQDIHGEVISTKEVNDYIIGLKKLLKDGFRN